LTASVVCAKRPGMGEIVARDAQALLESGRVLGKLVLKP
jgi:hypothetical protein